MKKFSSKGEVRFKLRMVSAGLLGDKERRGMCQDGRCMLCDEGVWKILCISCTVKNLPVIEQDWV